MFNAFAGLGHALESIGQIVAPVASGSDELSLDKPEGHDENDENDDESAPFDNKILQFIHQRREQFSTPSNGKKDDVIMEPSSPSSLVSIPLDDESYTQHSFLPQFSRSVSDSSTTQPTANDMFFIANMEKKMEQLTSELHFSEENNMKHKQQYEDRIHQLESECKTTKFMQQENKRQATEIQSFKKIVLELKQQLLEAQNINVRLKAEHAQVSEDFTLYQISNQPIKEEIEQPSQIAEDYEKVTREFNALKQSYHELWKELEMKNDALNSTTMQLSQLEISYKELQSEVVQHQQTLQQDLVNKHHELEDCQRQTHQQTQTIEELESKHTTRLTDYETLKKQYEIFEKQVNSERQQLQEQVTREQQTLRQTQQTVQLLERQLEELREKERDQKIVPGNEVSASSVDKPLQTSSEIVKTVLNTVEVQTTEEQLPYTSLSQEQQTDDDTIQDETKRSESTTVDAHQEKENENDESKWEAQLEYCKAQMKQEYDIQLHTILRDNILYILQQVLQLVTTSQDVTIVTTNIRNQLLQSLPSSDTAAIIDEVITKYLQIHKECEQLNIQIETRFQHFQQALHHQKQVIYQIYTSLAPHYNANATATSSSTPTSLSSTPPASSTTPSSTPTPLSSSPSSATNSNNNNNSSGDRQKEQELLLFAMLQQIITRYQEYKQQTSQYQQMIHQHQNSLQGYQDTLQEQKNKLLKSENENRQLHQIITQLRSQRSQQVNDTDQIQEELNILKQELQNYHELQPQYEQLSLRYNLLTQEHTIIQTEYHQTQQYKEELMTLTQAYYTIQQEYENANLQIKSLQQEVNTQGEEIMHLQRMISLQKEELSHQQDRYEHMQYQLIQQYQKEYEVKYNELEAIQAKRLQQTQSDCQSWQDQVETLQLTLRKYEFDQQKERKALQTQLHTVITQLQNSEHDVIDRKLIKNLIVSYFQRKRSREVLALIAKVLCMEEEQDLVILGLRVPPGNLLTSLFSTVLGSHNNTPRGSAKSTTIDTIASSEGGGGGGGGNNLAEMWVNFLLTQSEDTKENDANNQKSLTALQTPPSDSQ